MTTDPDIGSARVAEVYADNRLRVRGDRDCFHLEQSRADIGPVRFDTFSNTLTTEYTVKPLGHVMVARILDREMELWTGGTHRHIGPGDVALIAQPDHEYASRVHGARMELVGVDLALLDDVDSEPRGGGRKLRFEPLDAAQALRWQRTVDFVTDTLLDGTVATSPLVLGNAARLLAATLLAAFGAEQPESEPVLRADAVPALVRRAVAFCESDPDLDIGVVDIARACHVSVRALQLAFRRHLGTTPMAYLRRVRLDRVRRELTAADPADVTIGGVANRWGFADPSRFSAQYRAAYGELPRDTLRRR